MIRKFKVEVTRVDSYVVEIDDSIYNKEWIEEFEKHLHPLPEGIESIAEDIAIFRARCGERFQEGYGRITEDGYMFSSVDKEDYAVGIDISVESEDDECETKIEEIS